MNIKSAVYAKMIKRRQNTYCVNVLLLVVRNLDTSEGRF